MVNKFTPTAEMTSMALAVFKAMAFVETIKPVITANKKKVLDENYFRTGGKLVEKLRSRGIDIPEFVKKENETHHMTDEEFERYHRMVSELNLKAGLTVDHPDNCPLLVAENLLCRAENALLDVMKPVTGFGSEEACHSLEIRAKAIDLTLRLLAPFVKSAKK